MNKRAALLQSVGLAVLTAAGWLLTPVAGLGVLGVGLIVFGVADELGD